MKVHVRSKTCYTLAMSSNSNDFPMLPECGCGWGWGGEEVTSWSTAGSREGGVEEGWSEIVEGGGDGPADNTAIWMWIYYCKIGLSHLLICAPPGELGGVCYTNYGVTYKSLIKLQFGWIQRIVNAEKQVEKLKSNHTWFHSMHVLW